MEPHVTADGQPGRVGSLWSMKGIEEAAEIELDFATQP